MQLTIVTVLAVLAGPAADRTLGDDPVRTTSQASSAPEQAYDLGVLEQGRVAEHAFTLANPTGARLRIVRDRVTCGCISIVERPEAIAAEGSGRVVVRMRTEGKRGLVQERAVLETDDPKRGYFQLSIKAVVQGIWADPDQVDFGNLSTGEGGEREFYVIAAGLPELEVRGAVAADGHVRPVAGAAGTNAIARYQHLRALGHVRVALDTAGLPPGPFVSSIAIGTSDAGRRALRVPVVGYISGTVKCVPAKLLWSNATPGSRISRTCVLLPGTSAPALVPGQVALTADHDILSATLSPSEESGRQGLQLRVTLAAPAGPAEAKLLKGNLVGSCDGRRVFAIPYTAYLAPRGPGNGVRDARP